MDQVELGKAKEFSLPITGKGCNNSFLVVAVMTVARSPGDGIFAQLEREKTPKRLGGFQLYFDRDAYYPGSSVLCAVPALSNSPHRVGETVKARAVLSTRKPLQYQALEVTAAGTAATKWSSKPAASKSDGSWCSQKSQVFLLNSVVSGATNGPVQTLAPGCHVFSFEFTLPLNSPPSCTPTPSCTDSGVDHIPFDERGYRAIYHLNMASASVSYSVTAACTIRNCCSPIDPI